MSNIRRVTNVSAGEDDEQEVGVHDVQDVQADDATDEIVTPPDEMLADELQAWEDNSSKSKSKNKVGVKSSNVVASTSNASSKIKMNIHLADPSTKYRQTPAARKREAMNDAMLDLVKETHKQMKESGEEEDALDLSFISMAKRMCTNLNAKQIEKVHIAFQTLVNTAIDNAEQGLPVVPRPPNLLQPIRSQTPPNYMGPPGPPPPSATPVQPPAMQQQVGDTGGDYFQPGPPQLQMYSQF